VLFASVGTVTDMPRTVHPGGAASETAGGATARGFRNVTFTSTI
jgi:hypothetical protein